MTINFINKTAHEVDEKKIVSTVEDIFKKNSAPDNAEASIAVVHHSEVVRLACLYMNETEEQAGGHPVLSFLNSELEDEFIFPDDGKKHIGEIVVSYDKAVEESEEKSLSVDEALEFWVKHAALHLMEIHHD